MEFWVGTPQFMFFVEFVDDVKQNSSGLENSQIPVDESRNFAIGLTFEMFGPVMFIFVFLPSIDRNAGIERLLLYSQTELPTL